MGKKYRLGLSYPLTATSLSMENPLPAAHITHLSTGWKVYTEKYSCITAWGSVLSWPRMRSGGGGL